MPDYKQGKIYTIRCKTDTSLIYVGSTIQSLAKRFGGHKKECKRSNMLLYSKIENWNDWYIELYLNYPCNSVEELRKKEGEIIREIGTLNKIIAGRTIQQYNIDNPDRMKNWKHNNPEKMAVHREKDKIREIENGRREVKPCECGGRFSEKSIRTHEKSKKHQTYLNNYAGKSDEPLRQQPLPV